MVRFRTKFKILYNIHSFTQRKKLEVSRFRDLYNCITMEEPEEPSLDVAYIAECEPVYNHVTAAFPVTLGKATSKKDREELGLKDANLTYGEITFQSFGIVFEKLKKIYGQPNVGASGPDGVLQTRGGAFYDLGSGTGKPVIAAAILFNFDFCCGIEILEGLFSVSTDMLQSYNTRGKSSSLLSSREFETHCQMIQGDFLKMKTKDWRDGDVVFANSTCFDDKIMEKISKKAQGMKKGAFFVSLTKRLLSNDFVVCEHEMYPMSWGEATIYIMQKISEPRADEDDDED